MPPAGGRVSRRSGLAVFLLTALLCGWVTLLEFQLDDFVLIRNSGHQLGWTPQPVPPSVVPAQTYSFRPTLWAALFALSRMGALGTQPWLFHLAFLLAHATTAWLLYRLLRVRIDAPAAAIGALLFGILPGGIQAATWISAGGDLLAVLFALLACCATDRHMAKPSAINLGIVAAAVASSCMAKETAIVLIVPAFVLLFAAPPRDSAQRSRLLPEILLAALLGLVAAWATRAWYLSEILPRYWRGEPVRLSQLSLLPRVILGYLLPWDPTCVPTPYHVTLLTHVNAAPYSLVVAAVLIPIGCALSFGSWRTRLAVLALTATFSVVLLPLLPIVRPDGLGMSRACYPASAALGAALASTLSGLRRALPRIMLAAPFGILCLDVHFAIAKAEVMTAREISGARRDYEALDDSSACSIMVEPPSWKGTIPFLGSPFLMADCPPLGRRFSVPSLWPRRDTLNRCPTILSCDHETRILEWTGKRLALREVLRPIPLELPDLVLADDGSRSFRPRSPIPPRAIAGVMLDVAQITGQTCKAVFKLSSQTRSVDFRPRKAGPNVVGIPDSSVDTSWVCDDELVAITIEGVPLAKSPALLRALPTATVTHDTPIDRLPLESPPAFDVSFQSIPVAFAAVLVELIIEPGSYRVPLRWHVPIDSLDPRGDGAFHFVAKSPVTIAIEGRSETVAWGTIASRLRPHAHGDGWRLPADILVEGMDESGQNAVCRSVIHHVAFALSRPQ